MSRRVGLAFMQLMQQVIDGFEFARRNHRIAGRVAVAELGRVAEYLADTSGLLDFELVGDIVEDDRAHLELRLVIGGELQLICQRCLGAVSFELRLDKRLRLIAQGASWPDEDVEIEDFDVIEASTEMVVGSLIEDEVLLALPISPRHEVCGTPRMKDTQQETSPFAVLRTLKLD